LLGRALVRERTGATEDAAARRFAAGGRRRARPVGPLDARRAAAFVALFAAVAAYDVWYTSLPDVSRWWDIALLVCPIIPASLALIYLVLPLRRVEGWWLLGAAVALALLAFAFDRAGWGIPANFAKLFAPAFFGWWFLRYFESLSWVVLVALIIPFVDAYSVWKGPTHHIVTQRQEIFTSLSIVFPVPSSGAARLGLPDVLFFAVFLGAADRWGLRVGTTFVLTALSFGATVVIANGAGVDGLPALPLLSVAFLLANGDLLWRRRAWALR